MAEKPRPLTAAGSQLCPWWPSPRCLGKWLPLWRAGAAALAWAGHTAGVCRVCASWLTSGSCEEQWG